MQTVNVYYDQYAEMKAVENTYPIDYEKLLELRSKNDMKYPYDVPYHVKLSYEIEKKIDDDVPKKRKKSTKTPGKKKDEPPRTSLPFSSVEECASKKRTAKFYISKNDLIAYLDNNGISPNLKKGFKALPKEDICKEYYKKIDKV